MIIRLLFSLCLLFSAPAWSAEYVLIVPNGPGSGVDAVARAIQKNYQKITGNNLIIEYATGADTYIAVEKFKKNPRSLLIGTSTMLSVNPVFKTNVPYQDLDFDHIGGIASHPQVIYVNSNTGVTDIASLKTWLKRQNTINVGGDSLVNFVNTASFFKSIGVEKHATWVRYKSAGDTLIGTLAGTQPIGISAPNSAMAGHHRSGKIRIIASSESHPINVDGIAVPPIPDVFTFSGWTSMIIHPQWPDSEEAAQLRKDLWRSLIHPDTRATIDQFGLVSKPIPGADMPAVIKKQRQGLLQYQSLLNQ
jgi:tripartite-type tricarboxylate transporter receptor subunit TctC